MVGLYAGHWLDLIIAWLDRVGRAMVLVLPQALRQRLFPRRPRCLVDETAFKNDTVRPTQSYHLGLSPTTALSRVLVLPTRSARDALAAAYQSRIQHMPGDGEGLSVSYRFLGHGTAADQSYVLMRIIRTDRFDELRRLAADDPSRCRGFLIEGEGPWRKRLIVPRWVFMRHALRASAVAGLLALAFVFSGLIPALYESRVRAAVEAIDRKILQMSEETASVSSLQGELRALEGLQNQIADVRRRSQVLKVLEVLTRRSPDDLVVGSLRFDQERVFVEGVAASPEDWALALEDEALIGSVRLGSIVSGDGERRRFDATIDLQWQPAGAQGAPAVTRPGNPGAGQ